MHKLYDCSSDDWLADYSAIFIFCIFWFIGICVFIQLPLKWIHLKCAASALMQNANCKVSRNQSYQIINVMSI